MAQPPRSHVPSRTCSSQQHPAPQTNNQPGFALNSTNKQPQQSPIPSYSPHTQAHHAQQQHQPQSPSPYIANHSYSSGATPTTSAASPSNSYAHPHIQPATTQPPTYGGQPYSNGAPVQSHYQPQQRPHPGSLNNIPSPTMGAPQTPGTPGSAPVTPGLRQHPQQSYTNAAFTTAPPTPSSMMPPPSKPADKPAREYEYEVMDSLQGTGVNIREEENALAEYYAGSFAPDSRTGLPANTPGDRGSFYGAGFANQPGQPAIGDQKEIEAAAAERAFNESAARLSATRAQEHNNPFLDFPSLHYKIKKIAADNQLGINLDVKNAHVQKSRHPADYPSEPTITINTKVGPDGAMITTYGSIIPPDSYLIDQLALLSIATKQRLREMIEDSDKIATTRQQTSHGIVPEEWADVAAPLDGNGLVVEDEVSPRTGVDSAASPGTNPLKRSFDASNSQASGRTNKPRATAINHVAQFFRNDARAEREAEEWRLKKRLKRQEVAAGGCRSGSAAPGTPGAVAPEPEKAPTKKELKKVEKNRLEASSAANVNKTTMQFLGGGKKYNWMNRGASTPSRIQTKGLPGTPGAGSAPKAPESTALTQDSRTKMGQWREYSEKGKNIQMRDWIYVLERDGREKMALQRAYLKLDDSDPK